MKVKINFDGNWLPDIEISTYRFTLRERIKRSIKIFSLYLGAAVFSVLVPVLHFFLVPLFLLLSVFLSYLKFKEIISMDLRSLTCPECKANLKSGEVGLKENDTSVRLSCDSCRKTLTIILNNEMG